MTQRPIKFRVFSEKSGSMTEWDVLKNLHAQTIFAKAEGYHVMQFTGLKDRKGREIYEGDVVKNGGLIGTIVYMDELAAFGAKWGPNDADYTHSFYSVDGARDAMEVIGNIYENPELLKENGLI